MKKLWKITGIGIVLSLLLVLFPVSTVFAAAVTVTDTVSTPQTSADANHTITWTQTTVWSADQTIVVTFDTGFNLTDVVYTDVDLKIGESEKTLVDTTTAGSILCTINTGSGTVTFTPYSEELLNATTAAVEIQIGTNADSGVNLIANPSTAEVYTTSVTSGSDSGSDTVNIADPVSGTTTLDANPVPTITIDAPVAVTSWSLTSFAANGNTQAKEGANGLEIQCNTAWNVAVKDADSAKLTAGYAAGKMGEWDGSGYVASGNEMANALKIKVGAEGYVTLTAADLNLYASNQVNGDYSVGTGITTTFNQDINYTDDVLEGGHVYHIVVTFTASVKG